MYVLATQERESYNDNFFELNEVYALYVYFTEHKQTYSTTHTIPRMKVGVHSAAAGGLVEAHSLTRSRVL